jgi:iron complex outermembrane receptor protein
MRLKSIGVSFSALLALSFLGNSRVHADPAAAATTAATTASETEGGLQEIVVTATKRGNESIQDIPIAISAYSGQQLVAYDIQRLDQMDFKTPGLVFTESSNYVQPYIRGIGEDYPGIGLEPPVSLYIDDVYWQRATGGNYDLVDLQSLEVLKGPQGTLYGRNATGGAILMNTNNPTNKDEGSATVEGGSEGHERADLILNYAMTDQLAARLAVRYNNTDGYLYNPASGLEFGGQRSKSVRFKVGFTDDAFSVLWSIGYAEERDRAGLRQAMYGINAPLCVVCAITGATAPTGAYETYQGDEPGVGASHIADTNLRITVNFDQLTFTSITAGRTTGIHSGTDEGAYGGAPYPYALNIETAQVQFNWGNDLLQEFRLASHYNFPLNFLVGLNGQYSDEANQFYITGAAFTTFPNDMLYENPHLYTYSASPYAELYWDITSALKLTVGGRYNSDRKDATDTVEGGAFGPSYRYDDKWDDFTPRAVLAYSPDSTQNYYISYSTGFKSGGFNFPSFANSPTDILQPEKIRSYEVGAKNRFFNNRLQTTAAAFLYDYTNIQVGFVDPVRGEIKENAGAAKGYGLELDAEFAATDQLTVGAGYGYLHARFTSYPDASIYEPNPAGVGLVTTKENLHGTPLTRSPDNTVNANFSYNFPVTAGWKASVNGVTRYTSQYDFNTDRGGTLGLDYQRSYALTNFTGFIGPNDDRYKIGFYVNNAFNRLYYMLVDTGSLGVYRGPAPPRTYGANFTVKF